MVETFSRSGYIWRTNEEVDQTMVDFEETQSSQLRINFSFRKKETDCGPRKATKTLCDRDKEFVLLETVPMLEKNLGSTTEESQEAYICALYEVPGSLDGVNCDETRNVRAS